jgi:hypothetical protein
MPQFVIGQHQRHHGFAHRNGANADARIMATLGDNFRVVAVLVDRPARLKD